MSKDAAAVARQDLAESDRVRSKDLDAAERLALRAVSQAEALDDGALLATACQRVAVCQLTRGDHEGCERWLRRAHELATSAGDDLATFDVLLTRGVLHANRGELVAAVHAYTDALELAGRSARALPTMGVINNLGGVYGRMRDFDAAMQCYERVLEQAEANQQPHNAALALVNMGECHMELDRLEEARRSFERARPLLEPDDSFGLRPYLLAGLGELLSRDHRHDEALDLLDRAIAMHRERHHLQGLLQALSTRARILARRGDLRDAIVHLAEALSISVEVELPAEERSCCSDLASLHAELGEWEQAYRYQVRLPQLDAQLLDVEKDRTIRELTATHETEIQRLRNVELAEANASLRRAYDEIREQQGELSLARDAAERAARVQSEFLSNMSHELRTPLNAVLGTSEILQCSTLTDDQRELVEVIRQAGDLTLAIVDDILDLAKLEAGALELDPRPLQLRSLLSAVCAIVSARADARAIRLRHHVDPNVPDELLGDGRRLRQIILNLASNAVKFTPEGRVDLYVSRVGEMVRFDVLDEGVGIDPERVDELFDPFVQAESSELRSHGGTGLGLSICKRLVTMFEGQIGAEPRPTGGSRFWFTARLPSNERAAPEVTTEASEQDAEQQLPPLHVLVVEDVPANRMVLTRMLGMLGATAEHAHHGAEAVAKMREGRYDLVLMDCRMPVMDGYEATRRIRREQSNGRTPIIALTANALPDHHARCLEAGMDGVLTKPLRFEVLRRTLLNRFAPDGS
jgi:signal transduction histidine kinase/ActR/RegA family two-component response regulator